MIYFHNYKILLHLHNIILENTDTEACTWIVTKIKMKMQSKCKQEISFFYRNFINFA